MFISPVVVFKESPASVAEKVPPILAIVGIALAKGLQ